MLHIPSSSFRAERPLRVLIGCETSGVMRRAFAARGHDVTSCDLLPAEDGSNNHIVCDVRELLVPDRWDLLCVMHPPCTRLCRAGQRWLYGPGKTHPKQLPRGRTWEDMIAEFDDAVELFEACLHAPVPRRMIENPVMHIHAKERIRGLPEPQIVQPWWFGDPAFKATGLYLVDLPKLIPTNQLTPPQKGTDEYKKWSVIVNEPPGPDRARNRSRTFSGVADAAADQWAGWVPDLEAA